MTLSDTINSMIKTVLQSSTFTSAGGKNPVDNFVKDARGFDNPDIEEEIRKLFDNRTAEDHTVVRKERKEQREIKKSVEKLNTGNVKAIQDMTTEQFGNVKQLASDPFGFLVGSIGKKFGRSPVAKAGPAGFIAFLALEVGKLILAEFFKPGRLFDVRFRQIIDKQVVLFLERKEQQELRQAFKQVITTTVGGLRGRSLAGQVGGNFYFPDRIPNNFLDPRAVQDDRLYTQDLRTKGSIGSGKRNRSVFR